MTKAVKSILSAIILLLIIGALAFLYYKNILLTRHISQIERHDSTLNTQLNSLNTKLTKLDPSLFTTDFRLLKAGYLLEQASVANDWQITLHLLQLAQQILAPINSIQVNQLNQNVNNLITEIKAKNHVNVHQVLQQITSLQNIINDLPLRQYISSVAKIPNSVDPSFVGMTWGVTLKDTLDKLKQFVSIRYDAPTPLVFLPNQAQLARMNLLLQLQAVQWAVLNHNDAIYHVMLNKTVNMTQQYFDLLDATTKYFLQQLALLRQINLNEDNVDLTPALTELQQILAKDKP